MNESKPLIKAVLLDIEGTTTSISFVSECMFPYIRRELENYLKTTYDSAQTQDDIEVLRKLSIEDINNKINTIPIPDSSFSKDEIIKATVENVYAQMDKDRKTTALKQLQGNIWKKGFESSELEGDIYPDALESIRSWHDSGINIFIYSSGSVAAQKLIFGFNRHGNLLKYFSGHFDTNIGSKIESSSYDAIYNRISGAINLTKQNILFGTDSIKEAYAARKSGFNVFLSVRPGTAELPADHDFVTVSDFRTLQKYYIFENNAK